MSPTLPAALPFSECTAMFSYAGAWGIYAAAYESRYMQTDSAAVPVGRNWRLFPTLLRFGMRRPNQNILREKQA